MKNMDRGTILTHMSLRVTTPRVGDIHDLKCLQTESPSVFAVNKSNVSLLNFPKSGFCSGSTLIHSGRFTVGVPCFATEVDVTSKFCDHCENLWTGFDENDLATLDTHDNSVAFENYKQGRQGVLWNAPPIVTVKDLFSDEIQSVKDALTGVKCELVASWPDRGFKNIAADVLTSVGVTFQ